jgi:hypothetical protein
MTQMWCDETPEKGGPPPVTSGGPDEASGKPAEIIVFPGLSLSRLRSLLDLRRKIGRPYKDSPVRDEEPPAGKDD